MPNVRYRSLKIKNSVILVTEDLKYKLISYKNTNNKYQIIFEIMLNENYEINILKIINNLQLKNELKKIIEKYKIELKHVLINKFLLPINKTEKLNTIYQIIYF